VLIHLRGAVSAGIVGEGVVDLELPDATIVTVEVGPFLFSAMSVWIGRRGEDI
jgi:hypothetical protein